MRNLVGPADAPGALRVARSGAPSALVAPVAETQAALFRNLDTTFTALADGRPARSSRTRSPAGPPRWTPAIARLPAAAAVPAPTPRRCSASCARASRALRTAAPTLADALEIGTPTLKRSVAVQRAPEAARSSRCSASPRTRWSRSASTTSRAPRRLLNPTLAYLAPAQTICNYVDAAGSATSSSLLSEGDSNGTGAALHHHRHAAGPQQRGRPVLGAGQRRRAGQAGQLPAHQPVPEHRVARARPSECEARQRALRRRQAGRSATCPGNQGTRDRQDDEVAQVMAFGRKQNDRRRGRARTAPARARSRSAPSCWSSPRSSSSSASRSTSRSRTASASRPSSRRPNSIRHELAGAHRRRQRRQGQERRAASRAPNDCRRHDGDRQGRACRSTRTRR